MPTPKRSELTSVFYPLNSLHQIIRTGELALPENGRRFCALVKEKLGIDMVMCEVDAWLGLVFAPLPEKWFHRLTRRRPGIDPRRYHDEKTLRILVYFRGELPEDAEALDCIKAGIAELFWAFTRERGIAVSYHRLRSPEEHRIYAHMRKVDPAWGETRFLECDEEPRERTVVKFESFDSLVRWNLLADHDRDLTRYVQKHYAAKVYCGWDEKRQTVTHYVTFDLQSDYDAVMRPGKRTELTKGMLAILKKHDVWKLLTLENYRPIYVPWSSLSGEMKFSLLRG